MVFTPEIQPQLLDFVKDPFITEILPNITRYLLFAEHKEHYKHAFQKAGEIVTQLKRFQSDAQTHIQMRRQTENSLTLAAQNSNDHTSSSSTAIRKYKTLQFFEKISCLIIDDELKAIEAGYKEMCAMPANESEMSKEEIEQYQQSRI